MCLQKRLSKHEEVLRDRSFYAMPWLAYLPPKGTRWEVKKTHLTELKQCTHLTKPHPRA